MYIAPVAEFVAPSRFRVACYSAVLVVIFIVSVLAVGLAEGTLSL